MTDLGVMMCPAVVSALGQLRRENSEFEDSLGNVDFFFSKANKTKTETSKPQRIRSIAIAMEEESTGQVLCLHCSLGTGHLFLFLSFLNSLWSALFYPSILNTFLSFYYIRVFHFISSFPLFHHHPFID